ESSLFFQAEDGIRDSSVTGVQTCALPISGGVDVVFDPANPQTVFAVLWAARQAPWEIGSSWTLSAGNGLYKSTDGGATWRAVTRSEERRVGKERRSRAWTI